MRRHENQPKLRRLGVVIGLCAVVSLIDPTMLTARAQESQKDQSQKDQSQKEQSQKELRALMAPAVSRAASTRSTSKLAGRYFVDFRARTAASYGHAFLWYGRLNEQGKVGEIEVAGLHPASDSVIPYILGHIVPVPSETGKSYGDLDEQYLTANYRVYLTEADAMQVFAYIRHKQTSSPLWIAGVYNCTAFLADIADYMGLRTPATATWMYPENFINSLRDLNGGRQEIAIAASR
jgi:hypothetical protein